MHSGEIQCRETHRRHVSGSGAGPVGRQVAARVPAARLLRPLEGGRVRGQRVAARLAAALALAPDAGRQARVVDGRALAPQPREAHGRVLVPAVAPLGGGVGARVPPARLAGVHLDSAAGN